MSVVFLVLKACHVWDTPYDSAIGLGLVDLDLIVLAEWVRILLHLRSR